MGREEGGERRNVYLSVPSPLSDDIPHNFQIAVTHFLSLPRPSHCFTESPLTPVHLTPASSTLVRECTSD